MSLEITGKLILKFDTQQISDKFKKREFVLELAEQVNGNIFTNYAKLQLTQNKCEIIDNYNVGDIVKVSFNIRGNKWVKDGKENYITSLEAWRLEYPNTNQQAPSNSPAQQGQYGNQGGYAPNNYQANNYGQPANSAANTGFASQTEQADDLPF
jgi:single-stranded DNA-binding protein